MGLDLTEMVMELEEEFDIRIADHEAEHTRSVGDLTRLIYERVNPESSPACLSSQLFYRYRRGILRSLSISRRDVRPDTSLELLIPRHKRPKVWRRWYVAGLHAPRLRRPSESTMLIGSVITGAVAIAFILTGFGIPASLPAGFLILGVIAAFWITPGLATVIPDRAQTLRALVLGNLGPNGDRMDPLRHPSRWRGRAYADVAMKVRLIICENLGVNMDQLREDTRFVEDLGCD